jgi:hypothetical protein
MKYNLNIGLLAFGACVGCMSCRGIKCTLYLYHACMCVYVVEHLSRALMVHDPKVRNTSRVIVIGDSFL